MSSLDPSRLYHHHEQPRHHLDHPDNNLIGDVSSATLVRPLLLRWRHVKCRLEDCTFIVVVIVGVIVGIIVSVIIIIVVVIT